MIESQVTSFSNSPSRKVPYSLYPYQHFISLPMVCHNICERIYSKIEVGQSHYLAGKKYCRRCECYLITNKIFCPCCGMQLRTSPIERAYKQRLREGKRKLYYNSISKNDIAKATRLSSLSQYKGGIPSINK
jgi:hypothetical protein